MAKSNSKTRSRSARNLQPWEVDGLYFHKQFPNMPVEKLPREPKLAKVKAGAREVKTAAQDTLDTIKIQGLLTALQAVQRYDTVQPKAKQKKQELYDRSYSLAERAVGRAYDAKDAVSARVEKLRDRRHRVANYVGRAITARAARVEQVKEPKIPAVPLRKVLGKPPKQTKQPKPAQVRTEPRYSLPTNPLSKLLETTRGRRPGPRTAGAAAVALAALATSLAGPSVERESLAEGVAVPYAMPAEAAASAPARPASVMDSSLSSTWNAPRAEDKVVYNALPVPSINAVDYAARIEFQRAAAQQARYDQFERERAQTLAEVTRIPYVSAPDQTSTYNAASRAEMDEIRRIAEDAHEQAEIQRIAAERAAAVAQIQPGQLMATLSFTQTGEAEGAPAGTYTNFHGVRAGVPQTAPGNPSTAFEFDMGLPDILDNGFGIYLSTQVPDLDTGKETTNADMPIVILGHNQSTIHDPLNPNSTEAFRYPEKTVFRNPETGERGDMLTLTLADGSIRQYEAVSRAIVDINDPNVSDAIFKSPFGGKGLNAYWCEHPGETSGETSLRGVDYYVDVTAQMTSDPSLLSIHSQG